MRKNPKAMKVMPFILAETLGRTGDSANKAALWGLLLAMPGAARRNAARAGLPSPSAWSILARPGRMARAVGAAVRYGSVAPLMALHPNILQSEMIYNQLLEHPEGIWIGQLDPEANMKELRTPDRKIHLHIPELEEPLKGIDPESERKALTPDSQYPFILNAGRHTRNVANTLMRDPAWLKGKRGCTLAIHPDDAAALGIRDGETVRVTTQAGSARDRGGALGGRPQGTGAHPPRLRPCAPGHGIRRERQLPHEEHPPRFSCGNPPSPVCPLQGRAHSEGERP